MPATDACSRPNVSSRASGAALLAAALLAPLGLLGVGGAPATASANGSPLQRCVSPVVLGVPVTTQRLAEGVRLRAWDLPDASSTSAAQVRLTVVDSAPSAARLVPRIRKLPDAVDPMKLANGDALVALVNSGYFDYLADGDLEPVGPIAIDGRVVYAAPGYARVLRLDPQAGSPLAITARLKGALRTAGVAIPIAAVNTTRLATTGATIYTEDWSRPTTPRAGTRVLVRDDTILTIDHGSGRPPAGALALQIPRQWRAASGRLLPGMKVSTSARLVDPHGAAIHTAVGRGTMVLNGGRLANDCTTSAIQSRPRTLLAWDLNGHVWVATATSGRPDAGEGIRLGGTTTQQVATWLHQLGAGNAVAFDGGGSTIMLARIGGRLARVDLPANTWRRPIPVGLALLAPRP